MGLVEVIAAGIVVATSNSLVMVAELFSGSFEFISVVFYLYGGAHPAA